MVPDLFQDINRLSGSVVQIHHDGVGGIARQFCVQCIRRRGLNCDVAQVPGGLLNFCEEENVVNYGQNFCRHVSSSCGGACRTRTSHMLLLLLPVHAIFSIQPWTAARHSRACAVMFTRSKMVLECSPIVDLANGPCWPIS